MKKSLMLLVLVMFVSAIANASPDRTRKYYKHKKFKKNRNHVVNHYNSNRPRSGHKSYGCFEVF